MICASPVIHTFKTLEENKNILYFAIFLHNAVFFLHDVPLFRLFILLIEFFSSFHLVFLCMFNLLRVFFFTDILFLFVSNVFIIAC